MRVAIAGAGKVGRAIARELVTNGHHVLLIDRDASPARPGSTRNSSHSTPGRRASLAA